jgi:hypothetical protein
MARIIPPARRLAIRLRRAEKKSASALQVWRAVSVSLSGDNQKPVFKQRNVALVGDQFTYKEEL